MALPESGPISASMIRTELNLTSQVSSNFALSGSELAQYTDINALSISSSQGKIANRPNLDTPISMSEWYGYNHAFTQSFALFRGLKVPYDSPYTTFAQLNVGATSGLVRVTGSNFTKFGSAPSASIDYTLYYTTYSLDIRQSPKKIQKGVFNSNNPVAIFNHNYNAASGSIVTFVFRDILGVWTTKTGLNTGRQSLAGAGTSNAALAAGGFATPFSPAYLNASETFNGSSWTSTNSLSFARCALAGAGTQNAAVVMGGYEPGLGGVTGGTEEFNGTSWNGSTALNTARCLLVGMGTQNAALAVGGSTNSCYVTYCAECYNGTTWSAGTGVVIGRYRYCMNGGVGVGTQNAAIITGGEIKIRKSFLSSKEYSCWGGTEIYDGTTWSLSSANLVSAGIAAGGVKYMGGAGTQNDAIVFGGYYQAGTETPNTVCNPTLNTYRWNGITWSADKNLTQSRLKLAGAADSSNAALAFGGASSLASSGGLTCTESFTV